MKQILILSLVLCFSSFSFADSKIPVKGISPNKAHQKISQSQLPKVSQVAAPTTIQKVPLSSLSTTEKYTKILYVFSMLWALGVIIYSMANFSVEQSLVKVVLLASSPSILILIFSDHKKSIPLTTPWHWSDYALIIGLVVIPFTILRYFSADKHILRK